MLFSRIVLQGRKTTSNYSLTWKLTCTHFTSTQRYIGLVSVLLFLILWNNGMLYASLLEIKERMRKQYLKASTTNRWQPGASFNPFIISSKEAQIMDGT